MMKTIRQLTIVALVIVATGCEFKPFEPTGYIEPTQEPAVVPTMPPLTPEPIPNPDPEETLPIPMPAWAKVSPSEVRPGEEIHITGGGFTSSETVISFLEHEKGGIMAGPEGRADRNGFFEGNLAGMPSNSPPGVWTAVTIDGATGNSAEDTFTLLPIEPPEEAIQFAQIGVQRGGEMEFTASGFTAKEALLMEITRPDGTKIEHQAYADEYGRLDGTINVPVERPPGLYTVTVTGQSSGHEASGWFAVDPPPKPSFYGDRSWWDPRDDVTLEFTACQPTEIFVGDLLDATIGSINHCIVRGLNSRSKCWVTVDGKLFIHGRIPEEGTLAVQFDPYPYDDVKNYRWVFFRIKFK